jgi:hypothetical protein
MAITQGRGRHFRVVLPIDQAARNVSIEGREYGLSNYIEGEDLRDVSIDPEPGKQCHVEVCHGLGLRNNDRLPFEAAKPMPLAAMIALDPISPSFAHDQALGWDHCGIYWPMIGAVECPNPLGQAIDQLLQGCCITASTLPVSRTIAFPLGAGFSAWSAA